MVKGMMKIRRDYSRAHTAGQFAAKFFRCMCKNSFSFNITQIFTFVVFYLSLCLFVIVLETSLLQA